MTLRIVLAALLLTGCAEYALKDAESGAYYPGDSDEDSGDTLQRLRLDVYPNSGGPALEPQSWLIDESDEWSALDIQLESPVDIEGLVTGYEANPSFAADVPGEEVPVIATFELVRADDIAGGSTTSDADGQFSLRVTGGQDYVASIVPIDPSLLPFLVLKDLDLGRDLDFAAADLALGYGEPVYGQIVDSGGKPVTDLHIGLLDPVTGIAGPTVQPTAEGWYQLRALPGDYTLRVTGEPGSTVPTVDNAITVVEDVGASLDLDLGKLDPVNVEGTLLDPSGTEVIDAIVRFASTQLEQEGASLTVESNVDRTGQFLVELLPGSWTVEFIPALETGLSPVATTLEVGTTKVSMQDITVPELIDVVSMVYDPDGAQAAGVVLTATELGFDARSWSAVTDATGVVSLSLPSTPVRLTLTPPDASAAITHLTVDPSTDDLGTLYLAAGTAVRGQLEVGGEAVPYTVIELRDPDTNELYGTTFTDAEGSFSVRVQR